MSLYQAFRTNGAPTYYAANPTPWMADILEAGLIFAFCILAASFYVILPGIRGKEKIFTFIRVTLSLFIGGVIILTNFAYTWETSELHTRTKYKAGTGHEVTADIGVHIGLRGINITLKGDPEHQLNETINYNEHFSWEWEQGRLGFGPFAGPFNREYRAAQFRGLPLPILWIAEYFTFDGEGIRWGRHYRQAGWYSHIMLWLCFPLWLLANILFMVLIRYGAYFLTLTGACMVSANIIWASVRNFNELKIPFEDGIMTFSFGGSFYICLITGILCMLAGIAAFILDLRFPEQIVSFFGADVLQDADEVVEEDPYDNNLNVLKALRKGGSEEDDPSSTKTRTRERRDVIEMQNIDGNGAAEDSDTTQEAATPMKPPSATVRPRKSLPHHSQEEEEEEDLYEAPEVLPTPHQHRYEKRKSRGLTMRLQKSRRRRPPPPPPQEAEEDDLYVNEGFAGTSDVHINMR